MKPKRGNKSKKGGLKKGGGETGTTGTLKQKRTFVREKKLGEDEEFEFEEFDDEDGGSDNDNNINAQVNDDVPSDAHKQLLESVGSVLTSKLASTNDYGTAAKLLNPSVAHTPGGLTLDGLIKSVQAADDDQIKDVAKGVKKIKKSESKLLSKPLEKPAAQKITRAVLYETVKADVAKWDSIVHHNRVADQLVFPLNTDKKTGKLTTKDLVDEFVPETPLEEEIAKILHGEDYVKRKQAEAHGPDPGKSESEQYMMSVEEALEKHHEFAKLRALNSYEAAKAKRKNKIKSKKYHRLLRREKIKKQMREFEELQKTNPEAAMEKLEELDRARIQERMSLKHRNTTKWAKMQAARAKYNRESREVLSDQLKISRDLTVKRIESSDEEEEEEPASSMPVLVQASAANPTQTLINIRNHLNLGGDVKFDMKRSKSKVPELEDEDDDDDEQRNLIAEAFEDDDVVTEFQKKKQDEINKEKPADIDLSLPGWGEWGGVDIKPSTRKRKRFLIKAKPAPPRQDAKLPHVILNSEANLKLKEHQVRELPFPFTRVKEFEKMVRAPVGRTWIPEQSVKSLIAPKVITRLGAVIQPITEDMLANKPEKAKKLKLAGITVSRQRN